MKLVLASQSPRRRQMIESLGLAPEICPAHIDEQALPNELPKAHVSRLAREKCWAVDRSGMVLAADTIVVVDQRILGKPRDYVDFCTMMSWLSGRTHQVMTGWHLRSPQGERSGVTETGVKFVQLTTAQIDAYWGSGEPADKAGGYGIQGWGGLFVESIEGDFNNVVGLPLQAVARGMAELGLDPWGLNAR